MEDSLEPKEKEIVIIVMGNGSVMMGKTLADAFQGKGLTLELNQRLTPKDLEKINENYRIRREKPIEILTYIDQGKPIKSGKQNRRERRKKSRKKGRKK